MSTIEVYDILKQERKMMINTLGLPLGIAVDPLSGYDCSLIGYPFLKQFLVGQNESALFKIQGAFC